MAASKRKDWTELLGGGKPGNLPDSPEEPAAPPVTVLMHTIVGNPDNPRPEEDYADHDPEFRELKASMREIGQLQPLAVVSRSVFEQAKPDAVAQAPEKVRKLLRAADWVVVTGNRRLAAARQLGWTRIDIRVQDQLGDEDGRIDEAVIIENIHRKNLLPVKEAEYLAGMLARHGSQEEVARRIGKSQVYVSQRLALLRLAPDLQQEVDAGTLKIKQARQLAGQTADHAEQRARAEALKAEAAEPKPPRTRTAQPVQNRVLETAPDPAPESAARPVQNPVLNGTPAQQLVTLPDPRTNGAEPQPGTSAEPERRQVRMPWHDGVACAEIAISKMEPRERTRMMERMMEHQLAENERRRAAASG